MKKLGGNLVAPSIAGYINILSTLLAQLWYQQILYSNFLPINLISVI